MNLDNLYTSYAEIKTWKDKSAAHIAMKKLLSEVTTCFPKHNTDNLAWFIAALRHEEKKWFVVKVLEKTSPIPKQLINDLILAALLEPDPSFNRFLLTPAVRAVGVINVEEIILQLSVLPEVVNNDGVNKVMYWLPRIKK